MTALDTQFDAVLEKSPNKGGWTYVVMPGSAELRHPWPGQGAGPGGRPALRELLHGPRRRPPQAPDQSGPAEDDRKEARRAGYRRPPRAIGARR